MSQKFGRSIKLQIGQLLIEEVADRDMLAVSFDVSRSLGGHPNKASIQVLNLSKTSRAKLTLPGKISVSLAAGYVNDAVTQLFQGDVRYSNLTNEGVDWITKFETGDGSKAAKTARVNKSFRKPKPRDLLRELGRVLQANGIKRGNLDAKISEGGIVAGLNEYLGGVVLSGMAVDVMTRVCTDLGYEWSIQDEQIQILRPNETNTDNILRISPSSGLIGSPQLGKKGLITFRMLLDGRARPGGPIQLESENLSGDLRVEKIRHIGDTWGKDWYSDVEAKETKKITRTIRLAASL
jgi:hypothetical protein